MLLQLSATTTSASSRRSSLSKTSTHQSPLEWYRLLHPLCQRLLPSNQRTPSEIFELQGRHPMHREHHISSETLRCMTLRILNWQASSLHYCDDSHWHLQEACLGDIYGHFLARLCQQCAWPLLHLHQPCQMAQCQAIGSSLRTLSLP